MNEQGLFWKNEFGNEYINRNNNEDLIAANINLFSDILSNTKDIRSVIELGCNIGLNLKAIKTLKSSVELSGIEINENAYIALQNIEYIKSYNQSILDFKIDYKRDFVFTKGVLIHINPEELPEVYDLMYNMSNKYICMVEYYNPTPVSVDYRGYKDKLFKRDFAGEFMKKYKDIELVSYGFKYRYDNNFSQDDVTWFLMKK